MQVALHVGAQFTDDDRLIRSLGKNTEMLRARGIEVPPPSFYRRPLRDLLNQAKDSSLPPGTREALLDDLSRGGSPDRMVLSNSHFFGVPKQAIRQGQFYPRASERLQQLVELLHSEDIEIFLAIRDPATFLPALLDGTPEESLDELTGGTVPLSLRWSELVMRIRQTLPNAPVTVWCNEDTPLIWEEVMREMAGLDPTVVLEGGNDLLKNIMSQEGLSRFKDYVDSHPGMTEMQKRRVVAAFLDKFALEEELEEELDIPGWSEDLIDTLTEAYDEDVFQIERIPGVTLITP
ncbi:hypothetical protein [Shimia abyssi]|uniref:Sulfotransferase family protein n=1 Tax=Shimia abyssi TaxID=1662395 RepID=A0A2P8FFM4_9RHOB|nr:hypothetical protein [Shimia abyssi]PSL20511.1 hypothetical protein CLV88_103157 [Shimia abyssi]